MTHYIPRVLNTSIAHYKVTAKLGQGGMGEVYRATDTKLDREVAIKILPKDFSEHPERVARFEREAKALARLNHPNVATIHGFEREGDIYFLVLELIEGKTLQERLQQGPMTVEETLEMFQQIAIALEAAHAKEIVHRDLKPANIKIDPEGHVKVLDFGLAKARLSGPSETEDEDATMPDSISPTITSQYTQPGRVMGTAAYMSPEQARGQEVDKRTDVWAFGCCLYEALTGHRPFKGETTSDLMAEILKSDPDFTTLPKETPREVLTMLRGTLEKAPKKRLRDLGDIAISLETSSTLTPAKLGSSQHQNVSKETVHPKTTPNTSPTLWLKVVGSIILALGFAYAVIDLLMGFGEGTPPPESKGLESIHSVAVLRIEPIGGDTDLAVVANGLEADIRQQLSRIQALEKHPPWRTVEKLAKSEKTEAEIANELGVDALVDGRLYRIDDQIRLNVSLVLNGNPARIVWETNLVSVNPKALESQTVLTLHEQFGVPLNEFERDFLERGAYVSIEAYTEYHKGIDALDVLGFENAKTVVQHFANAIIMDPGFLPPYIQQAWALWWPTIYGEKNTTSEQAFLQAFKILDQAQLKFPEESIIQITRDFFGMVSDFKFKQAKESLQTALLNAPDDPDLQFMNLWYLVFIESRYPEALLNIRKSITSDPNRIAFQDALAEVYTFMENEEEALKENSKIAGENQEDFDRLINNAFSHKLLGNFSLALNFAHQAIAVSKNHPASLAVLAEIHAAMGQEKEARTLLKRVETMRKEGQAIPHNWNARVEAQLGDTQAAASSLRAAYENREGWSFLYSMRYPPFVRLMANEPAYWELVHEMKYPNFPINHPLYELEQKMRYSAR